ncbi:GntR family transcriptional regulator [Sphingobium sp.]|uniref:GntR family transcriptional regulator n=1 Tax=Sphingobium sp. TaxID=1912891 RepID=UPI003B3A6DE3
MSPAQILERSYDTLKRRLIAGDFDAGQRLEAARLSEQMHVSITPVRDVLNRLTGEGLVEAIAGGGFYVPILDEGRLRDLLDWNSFLSIQAVRMKRVAKPQIRVTGGNDAARAAHFFSAIAGSTGNRELVSTVSRTNDRLYAMRLLDTQVLTGVGLEFEAMEQAMAEDSLAVLVKLVRAYHRRRVARLPTYMRLLREAG